MSPRSTAQKCNSHERNIRNNAYRIRIFMIFSNKKLYKITMYLPETYEIYHFTSRSEHLYSTDEASISSFWAISEASLGDSDKTWNIDRSSGSENCKSTGFLVNTFEALYSTRISSAERISFQSQSRMREFDQTLLGRLISPGMTNTSRSNSSANLAVMSVPDLSAASPMSTPRESAATISLRTGKLKISARVLSGKIDISAHPEERIESKRDRFWDPAEKE